MSANAMMVPTNVVAFSAVEVSVAELCTVQKTLHAIWSVDTPAGRLANCTVLPADVMRLDDAWKIQTEFGSLWASSVSVPLLSVVPDAKL